MTVDSIEQLRDLIEHHETTHETFTSLIVGSRTPYSPSWARQATNLYQAAGVMFEHEAERQRERRPNTDIRNPFVEPDRTNFNRIMRAVEDANTQERFR